MKVNNIIFLGLGLIFLTLSACRKKDASWTTDWVLPLVNDSLLISDYVKDSLLESTSDNSIHLALKTSVFDIDLSEIITIPDTVIEQSFSISVNNMVLNPGVTFVNDIKEHSFDIEGAALKEGRVKEGVAVVYLSNSIKTKGVFKISLPGVEKNGVEFTQTRLIDAATASGPKVERFEFDLSGYSIDMRGKDWNLYNIIQSKMEVMTDPEGEAVSITSQDEVSFGIEMKNFKIDFARGYFGSTTFSDTLDVELSDLRKIISGNINIEEIQLNLFIRNGIDVRAKGLISRFESINQNTGTTVQLEHPYFNQSFPINPAIGEWDNITPSTLDFNFDYTTGNIKDFIENLGDKYNIGFDIELNPMGNTSGGNDALYPNSSLGIDLHASFPLKVGIDNLVLVDTFEIDFKNDIKLLKVESGLFKLKTTNTFPYGVAIDLSLLNEANEVIAEIPSQGQVSPATSNHIMGIHEPIEEVIEFLISEKTAELLKDTKYIMLKAKFNSTHYNNNILYSNAAIKFILMSQLKLKTSL